MSLLEVCRACMSPDILWYPAPKFYIHEFTNLTKLAFQATDNKPQGLCHECCIYLRKFCHFRKRCLQADVIQKQILDDDQLYKEYDAMNRELFKLAPIFTVSSLQTIEIPSEIEDDVLIDEEVHQLYEFGEILDHSKTHKNYIKTQEIEQMSSGHECIGDIISKNNVEFDHVYEILDTNTLNSCIEAQDECELNDEDAKFVFQKINSSHDNRDKYYDITGKNYVDLNELRENTDDECNINDEVEIEQINASQDSIDANENFAQDECEFKDEHKKRVFQKITSSQDNGDEYYDITGKKYVDLNVFGKNTHDECNINDDEVEIEQINASQDSIDAYNNLGEKYFVNKFNKNLETNTYYNAETYTCNLTDEEVEIDQENQDSTDSHYAIIGEKYVVIDKYSKILDIDNTCKHYEEEGRFIDINDSYDCLDEYSNKIVDCDTYEKKCTNKNFVMVNNELNISASIDNSYENCNIGDIYLETVIDSYCKIENDNDRYTGEELGNCKIGDIYDQTENDFYCKIEIEDDSYTMEELHSNNEEIVAKIFDNKDSIENMPLITDNNFNTKDVVHHPVTNMEVFQQIPKVESCEIEPSYFFIPEEDLHEQNNKVIEKHELREIETERVSEREYSIVKLNEKKCNGVIDYNLDIGDLTISSSVNENSCVHKEDVMQIRIVKVESCQLESNDTLGVEEVEESKALEKSNFTEVDVKIERLTDENNLEQSDFGLNFQETAENIEFNSVKETQKTMEEKEHNALCSFCANNVPRLTVYTVTDRIKKQDEELTLLGRRRKRKIDNCDNANGKIKKPTVNDLQCLKFYESGLLLEHHQMNEETQIECTKQVKDEQIPISIDTEFINQLNRVEVMKTDPLICYFKFKTNQSIIEILPQKDDSCITGRYENKIAKPKKRRRKMVVPKINENEKDATQFWKLDLITLVNDINLLNEHLLNISKKIKEALIKRVANKDDYNEWVESLYYRVLLLNYDPEVTQKILMRSYLNYRKSKPLRPIEKESTTNRKDLLLQGLTRIDRTLFNARTLSDIKTMLRVRKRFFSKRRQRYLFTKTFESSIYPVRGWHALRKFAGECNMFDSRALYIKDLRKYVVTANIILNMSIDDTTQLSKGLDLVIPPGSLKQDLVQVAKLTKLLTADDDFWSFNGVSLQDIVMDTTVYVKVECERSKTGTTSSKL